MMYLEIESLGDSIRKRVEEVNDNMFISQIDKRTLEEYANTRYQELAKMRYDMQKLEEE